MTPANDHNMRDQIRFESVVRRNNEGRLRFRHFVLASVVGLRVLTGCGVSTISTDASVTPTTQLAPCGSSCPRADREQRTYDIACEPILGFETLTGSDSEGKTWSVSPTWGLRHQAFPFVEISVFTDGTWRDSSGLTGIWRTDRRHTEIVFEVDQLRSVLDYKIVELTSRTIELELSEGTSLCRHCPPGSLATLVAKYVETE